MQNSSNPKDFARRWIDAWNSRDLEDVLTLYDHDAEMVSPVIVKLGINAEGRLRGKDRLRAYWATALQRYPNLKFKLIEVFASPDSIVVRYENQREKLFANICGWVLMAESCRVRRIIWRSNKDSFAPQTRRGWVAGSSARP